MNDAPSNDDLGKQVEEGRIMSSPLPQTPMSDDITNHLSANGFDPTAVPRTKAFLIGWSEGDPILVLADDFNEAIETFCTEMADEDCTSDEIRESIESINVVADEIISARKNY